MTTQVTKGIKISVNTTFEGTFFKNYKMHFAFGYTITIENQSQDAVQLTSRHWEIYDALNELEIIDGEGVIGKKPVIKPGYYSMVNFSSTEKFKVNIPTFRFSAPFALN